jgi:hypothetical protein
MSNPPSSTLTVIAGGSSQDLDRVPYDLSGRPSLNGYSLADQQGIVTIKNAIAPADFAFSD